MRFILLGGGIFYFSSGLISASIYTAIINPELLGFLIAFFVLSLIISMLHLLLDESMGKLYEPYPEKKDSTAGESISATIGLSILISWLITSSVYFGAYQMWWHLGVVGVLFLILIIATFSFFSASQRKQQQQELYDQWQQEQE